MGKKTVKSNIHVAVYPRGLEDFGFSGISGQARSEEDEIAVCEEIAREIRLRVSNLPSDFPRGTHVVWDNMEVCEHCGEAWKPTCFGNICCSKEEEESGF